MSECAGVIFRGSQNATGDGMGQAVGSDSPCQTPCPDLPVCIVRISSVKAVGFRIFCPNYSESSPLSQV